MNRLKTEAIHIQTQELLQQAMEQLLRLPHVPTTTHLALKIHFQIEDPDTASTLRRAKEACELARRKSGALAGPFPSSNTLVDAIVSNSGIQKMCFSGEPIPCDLASYFLQGGFHMPFIDPAQAE